MQPDQSQVRLVTTDLGTCCAAGQHAKSLQQMLAWVHYTTVGVAYNCDFG